MNNKSLRESSFLEKYSRMGSALVIFWYLTLCLVQYFYQRPLWNDEAAVFASIQSFDSLDFFRKTLEMWQVFPRVYLFIIQKISKPFSFHLLSLRLPAFICMLTGFCIWLKIAKYEIKNSLDYFIFVLSWAASSVLVYYSSELKPYSMDVLTASIFILFLYNQKYLESHFSKGNYCLLLCLLPILGLLSYPAFLFMMFPLYNLVLTWKTDKKFLLCIVSYVIVLGAVTLFAYFFDMRLKPTEAVTTGFGDYFISFESTEEFFKTFGEGTMNLFSRWFGEKPRIIKKIAIFFLTFGLLNMVYSFFMNIKKDRYRLESLHTIAFIVFFELFILGALKKYPFSIPRTSLFFCPIVLFLSLKGIGRVERINKGVFQIIRGVYIVFLLIMIFLLTRVVFTGNLTPIPLLWG